MQTRTIATNGVELNTVEAGDGPLVVLCHGFPEISYSWRHQIPALAAAGYRVLAPDQRGYGRSSRPAAIDEYDIVHLTDDILGLMDAVGEEQAVVVGHDWGSMVVWMLAQRAPERIRGVVGMSVPAFRRGAVRPTTLFKQVFGDTFFYMLYFQKPGVADEDLGRDPARTMRGFLAGVKRPADNGGESLLNPGRRDDGRGMVGRLPDVVELPDWLSQEELDHYVAEFTHSGFTGGLNWYRNMDRNWELSEGLTDVTIDVPAAFIGGTDDPVLVMSPLGLMDGFVTDLRATVLVEGAGHWVQQERPDEVNAALLSFLAGL